MKCRKPISVSITQFRGNALTSEKWRVSHHRIKARILPRKDLRQLDFPVERRYWRLTVAKRSRKTANFHRYRRGRLVKPTLDFLPLHFTRARLVGRDEGRYDRITEKACVGKPLFNHLVARFLDRALDVVGGQSDLCAAGKSRFESLSDQLPEQRQSGLTRIPMHSRDLYASQPDETVPAFQRMVEERELVVARQGRQPQR